MRRHTAIPVKTSAVAVLIMAGAGYMAAEARQAVIRKQQLEIARIEDSAVSPINQIPAIAQPAPKVLVVKPAPVIEARPQGDELTAERQAASMPAQKPLAETDGHRRQIVISIRDRRLALLEDGKLVKAYPIAVGARVSPSPDGEFAVINHAKHPTYRHGGKEILPGKDNPLGTRWIGLSLKGYGIHGTNVPSSIGKAASHGCFRMGQADVEDLYSRVQVGDTVIVRRERDEWITRIFAAPATPLTEEVASIAGSTTEAAE
jgi:lipoprotein-anchoring transpeptidase ErfK/SrfK